MQKIIIIGNLVRDPESKEVSGANVCTFTVAVNTRYRGEDRTAYYRVDAWSKLGEMCKAYLKKGSKCCVVGDLDVREFTTREGAARTALNIRADNVEFLSSSGASTGGRTDAPNNTYRAPSSDVSGSITGMEDDDDDLPF